MTEQVVSPPKLVVSFRRTLSQPYPDYESADAFASVEAVLDNLNPSGEEVQDALAAAFDIAQAAVFDTIGVDYSVDPVTNRVVENLRSQTGAKVVEQQPKGKAPLNESDDKEAAWRQLAKELAAGAVQIETKSGVVKGFPSFWDNRETKKGRQPDFKVRGTRSAREAGLKADTALWVESAPDWFDVSVEAI